MRAVFKQISLDLVVFVIMFGILYSFGWSSNFLLLELHVISQSTFLSNTDVGSLLMFAAAGCMCVAGLGAVYLERKDCKWKF